MSLTQILANFLKISEPQAQAIKGLLALESDSVRKNISSISTQNEFIDWLQHVGQTTWFKGHDRSKAPDSHLNQIQLQEQYIALFNQLGLLSEVAFAEETLPPCLVVLGSGQTQVHARTQSLIATLKHSSISPMTKVIGLGSNRELGKGVLESEIESIEAIQEQGKSPTEIEMVNLIVTQALDTLKKEDARFSEVTYHPINTTGAADRASALCVKTADTAQSLKEFLEQDSTLSTLPKPLHVVVFSCNPFIERQRRDVQEKLGNNFTVTAVGKSVNPEVFEQNPKAMNICLGEVARLINIEYFLWKSLSYQTEGVRLTPEELTELSLLSDSFALPRITEVQGSFFSHANTLDRKGPHTNQQESVPLALS